MEEPPAILRTPPRAGGDGAPSPSAPRLRLPRGLRERLAEAARAGLPDEVCGVLVGRSADGETGVVREVTAGNLRGDRPHDRYLLDPLDFLAADRAARRDGLDVVGFWHSHPAGPARPSATDVAEAWEGYSYLIVAPAAGGGADLRSWRLLDGAFREETLITEDTNP